MDQTRVKIKRTITADEAELERKRLELFELEAQLAQSELDLATFRAEMRALELLYQKKVGSRLAFLHLIDARIAEILSRLNPDDTSAKKKAQKARRQAEESGEEADRAKAAPEEATRFKPSEDLKSLYREAAKRIHPDLSSNDEERGIRNQWMMEVNAAYQAGDEDRLRSLLEAWENSPESVQGMGIPAELERVIRKIAQIQERLNNILAEFDRLRTSFSYSLKQRIEEAKAEGRDLLEEMAARVEKRINIKQTFLDELIHNFPEKGS